MAGDDENSLKRLREETVLSVAVPPECEREDQKNGWNTVYSIEVWNRSGKARLIAVQTEQ